MQVWGKWFHSLPDDTFFSKLKAFADDKLNNTQNIKFVFKRIENIVVKGENAGYQHFLLFPTMFSKCFSPGASKSRHCVIKG